jgi:hypothetical protein
MSTPEKPKDIKELERELVQPISKTLKASLAEALRNEFGTSGRVALKTNFVKQDAPQIDFDVAVDLERPIEGTLKPDLASDLEKPINPVTPGRSR